MGMYCIGKGTYPKLPFSPYQTEKQSDRTCENFSRLAAYDPDSGSNGQISYRIISGNDFNIVTIARESGAVMFNEWNEDLLGQFKNASWTTVVEIRDHGHPSRY